MAMENKRIIQLNTERTTPAADDYVMVDSATAGTAKYLLPKITDAIDQEISDRTSADTAINGEITQLKEDLTYLYDGYEIISFDIIENSYPAADGTFPSYSNWNRSDYIPVTSSDVIHVINTGRSTSDNAWYDSEKSIIGRFSIAIGDDVVLTPPANAAYMVISNQASTFFGAVYKIVTGLATRDEVDTIKSDLTDTNSFIKYLNNISDDGNTIGIELGGRLSTSRLYSLPINTIGDSITISTSDDTLQFALAIGDASSVLTAWRSPSTTSTKDQWDNGLSLWIQRKDKSTISDSDIDAIINSFTVTYNVKTVKDQIIDTVGSVAYVATNGSDNADGSELTPFATVNAALEKGYRNILVNGGIYKQKIDLSRLRGAITLSAVGMLTPVFKDPDVVEITSATQHSGIVYVADADASVLSVISWIFQDGVEDITTAISYMERMPEQRGRTYRCSDTKIVRCTANSLSDAITEIQGATSYMFFFDQDSDKLYFSAPSSDFTEHPICFASGAVGLFENGTNENTVHITGIECKYTRLNLDNTVNSTAEYCKASCAYAPTLGQYTWDGAKNTKFLSCEAALSAGDKSTASGDGFNAHYSSGTGDNFAHISGTELINCWAHDNRDDGYSEHQRSESTVIGGLYEYNGKGGITPANGCHCECIGVVARNNYSGFVCCNGANAQEGGIGTQLLCVNCTAYGNNGSGTGHGFDCFSQASDYTHNTMVCVNCAAYDNLRCGYSIGHTESQDADYGKLIDCKASNNGVSAYRAYGTIEIVNNSDVVSV